MKYKTVNDFEDEFEWELYLMSVGIHALDPTIDIEFAYNSVLGFALYFSQTELPITPNSVLDLVNDMKAGPGPDKKGMH